MMPGMPSGYFKEGLLEPLNFKDTKIYDAWIERIQDNPWTHKIAGTFTLQQSIRLPEGNFARGNPTRQGIDIVAM